MIYLDCAATSLQKPRSVYRASQEAMRRMASPGRGGHRPAMLAADTAYACREELAGLFNVPNPEQVVFTLNATHGLNIAANDLASPGDRVVVSGYEHNAVTRSLRLRGAFVDAAVSPLFDTKAVVKAFRARIPGAAAVFCTHVSNVFGFVLPVYEIAALCREYGVPFVLDASQSAGLHTVDWNRLGARFVAMPGHKGLLGPQGTGVLLCAQPGAPLMAGGTGTDSRNPDMPELLPDRYEAGTLNITGIAGLLEGVRYVKARGTEKIAEHEKDLARKMTEELADTPGMELFAARDAECQAGVLSLRCRGADCEELAYELGKRGVAVRAGLHCAPLAHNTAGTLDTGTLRMSFSPFNTGAEVRRAAAVLKSSLKNIGSDTK